MNYQELLQNIRSWAKELGFQQLEVSDVDLSRYSAEYLEWLQGEFHGTMRYMARNVPLRTQPDRLLPGTVRIISVRMDYLDEIERPSVLSDPSKAFVSRYALGRDYHKVLRRRLTKLGTRINERVPHQYRAFVDSAPVMEKPLAEKAGIGWVGKHTLVLNEQAGSFFFLGELFTNLPLPVSKRQVQDRCGACKACISVCPTEAIIGPKKLDARRCISYLTIEHKGTIPDEFREAIGNRIFGCDDCQLICPWNRYAHKSTEPDFVPRHGLDHASILELLAWDEREFLRRTEGMALRRINYSQWVRNLAIAAGNAPSSESLINAVQVKRQEAVQAEDDMQIEHLDWALKKLSPETTVSTGSLDTV